VRRCIIDMREKVEKIGHWEGARVVAFCQDCGLRLISMLDTNIRQYCSLLNMNDLRNIVLAAYMAVSAASSIYSVTISCGVLVRRPSNPVLKSKAESRSIHHPNTDCCRGRSYCGRCRFLHCIHLGR
jgi:hypothetical protein